MTFTPDFELKQVMRYAEEAAGRGNMGIALNYAAQAQAFAGKHNLKFPGDYIETLGDMVDRTRQDFQDIFVKPALRRAWEAIDGQYPIERMGAALYDARWAVHEFGRGTTVESQIRGYEREAYDRNVYPTVIAARHHVRSGEYLKAQDPVNLANETARTLGLGLEFAVSQAEQGILVSMDPRFPFARAVAYGKGPETALQFLGF